MCLKQKSDIQFEPNPVGARQLSMHLILLLIEYAPKLAHMQINFMINHTNLEVLNYLFCFPFFYLYDYVIWWFWLHLFNSYSYVSLSYWYLKSSFNYQIKECSMNLIHIALNQTSVAFERIYKVETGVVNSLNALKIVWHIAAVVWFTVRIWTFA